MSVEPHGSRRVDSRDSTAVPRTSTDPSQGGLAFVSVTVIRCLHDHPVRGIDYRPHGATLGSAAGEWFPTGRVLRDLRPADLADLDLDCDHHLGYCRKCKAATEYRKAG